MYILWQKLMVTQSFYILIIAKTFALIVGLMIANEKCLMIKVAFISSHMLDFRGASEENIDICKEYLRRMSKIGMT